MTGPSSSSATARGAGCGSSAHNAVSASGRSPTKGDPPRTVRPSDGSAPATMTWNPLSRNASTVALTFPRHSESSFTTTSTGPVGSAVAARTASRADAGSVARWSVSTTVVAPGSPGTG